MKLTSIALLALCACGGNGVPPDGGSPHDAGASFEVIHGCERADFVDRTAASGDRKVGFGTALGSPAVGYSPNCITVAAGQSVTFVGSFNSHPLVGGEYLGDAGSPNNPIGRHDTGSTDLPIAFSSAGLYPFYCDLHAPTMVGVVQVQ